MSASPVDLEAFQASLDESGIPDVFEQLLDTFLREAPKRAAGLQEAFDGASLDGLRREAHAYRSAADVVKADALATDLGEAERAAAAGELEAALAAAHRALAEHERVVAFLESRG